MINIVTSNLRIFMKAIGPIAVALVVIFLLFSNNAFAETQFKEGIHYTAYKTPLTKQPLVVEYFSVFCPACNNFNKYQKYLEKAMPEGVIKRRVHVDLLKGSDPQGMKSIAQVVAMTELYADQLETNPVDDLFDLIHVHNGSINASTAKRVVAIHDDINKNINLMDTFNSDTVKKFAHASTMNQIAMQKAGALTSVPTLMVNGRYKVNLGALSRDRAFEELSELITFLNRKDF